MTSRQGKEVSSERQYRGNGTSPGMREAVSDSFKKCISSERNKGWEAGTCRGGWEWGEGVGVGLGVGETIDGAASTELGKS